MELIINLIYDTKTQKWSIPGSGVTYSAITLNDILPQIRTELKRQADEIRANLAAISNNVESL